MTDNKANVKTQRVKLGEETAVVVAVEEAEEKATEEVAAEKVATKTVPKVAVKPVAKTTTPPIPVSTVDPQTKLDTNSEAYKIWHLIRDRGINMFGLPNQRVSMHCTPAVVEPSKLYLTIRSPAVLPALEEVVAPSFTVEMQTKWVVVAPALPKV